MSRWGPRLGDRTTTGNISNSNNINQQYRISPVPGTCQTVIPSIPPELKDDEGDRGFELIDSIEWGDPDHPYTDDGDELAIKPRPDRSDDPCVCCRPADPTQFTCNDLSCVLFACQEECRSSCPAGDQCGNKRIQKKEWKQVEVFSAGPKGRGLQVLEDVAKGDFVVEYVGRAIPKHYLPHLFSKYAQERRLYIMALDSNVYLDARKRGGIARYINHSCDPNCVVERWKVRGQLRAAVIATRDIPAGTELSFDYQWERKRGRAPTKCHCGASSCRGTLEVPRSMEEAALERKLSTHWNKPLISRARNEIVNRCVRVWSKETQEYFIADVTAFDDANGKHLLMYRHDLEEVWEDLKNEDWMILDEEGAKYIINRKKLREDSGTSGDASASLLQGVSSFSSIPNMLLQGVKAKNYIYVQTPIKEALISKHLMDRCQRTCQVTITPQQFARPPLPPDPNDVEEQEKYQALDHSQDGTVWKLNIVGIEIVKAHNILEKNVAYLEKQFGMVASNGASSNGITGMGAANGPSDTSTIILCNPSAEVILPRIIVDSVKRRLPFLREKCRSVNITFVPSESKSKQFAKLVVEGTLQSDVDSAKEQLWRQLVATCEENKAPKTPSGIHRDLAFLGGELSSKDFHLLLQYDKTRPSSNPIPNAAATSQLAPRHSAKEDLTRWSPFFTSFESTQRCTIWVQADEDKGRIDASNRIVSEAVPNGPRKIYLGCEPKTMPKLWSLIVQRAAEVSRGVKYLYLGPDRLYQPMMMRNSGQFFEYVRYVTGASVTVDSMTGDHLRIDGKGSPRLPNGAAMSLPVAESSEVPDSVSEGERAALAEELIRLQIELYRDHCIRQQGWIFGRDWTFARRSTIQNSISKDDPNNHDAPGNNRGGVFARGLSFDSKSVSNACSEIADIVTSLEMKGNIAAHAAIIFYRFATILSEVDATDSLLKMREVELACVFLANKAQKKIKWKKLDAVLEAAYKNFYPGVNFESTKEEVLVWEEKVIAAEAAILETLDYDIFWRGFDWVVSAAVEAGNVDVGIAKDALMFAFSGPILATGPDLWLTYGAEYVFAATAAFLDANLEPLFSALGLIPIKVHQAAEMVCSSMRNTSFGKVLSSNPLFKEGKQGLLSRLPKIKEVCAKCMITALVPGFRMEGMSEKEQRYRLLGQQSKFRRIFKGVDAEIIKECILPALDGICAESNCSISLEQEDITGVEQIILEGSWRALAIASYQLQQAVGERCKLFPVDNIKPPAASQTTIQAKGRPGLLQMNKIETFDGWADTIQSQISTQAFWGRKTGGKSCLPGKIKESALRQGGLRWWIPPRYGPCPTGSICDMFEVKNSGSGNLEALANLTQAFQGESAAFSMLTSIMGKKTPSNGTNDRFVAVSLQRWPTEKVAKREQGKDQKEDKKSKKQGKRVWQTGFSAGALQEMQLLYSIHGLIKSPKGHPNFLLPIAIGLPSEDEQKESTDLSGPEGLDFNIKRLDEDIFSLTRSSLENEIAAEQERKRKDMVTGPHLLFYPTPFVLQRFTVRKKGQDGKLEDPLLSPSILAAWMHDLLAALLHCHSNDIILRSFLPDQIMVDHSGVAKFGSFYRATVLSKEDKKANANILRLAIERKKDAKKSKKQDEDDEVLSNPYAPPEMLLGSPRFTKETDIWTLGCVLCHLLLGKPAYMGKNRQSLLLAIYKLAGIPTKENFKDGMKFPYFEKPKKKYAPGVAKALTHMMKDENTEQFTGALDLISKMLVLDPKGRISAKEAMQHEFMQTFVEKSSTGAFQNEFVEDWVALKQRLMRSRSELDEINERERGIKRKAMLLAASNTTTSMADDDLYDMDDILGDEGSTKTPRLN